MEALKGVDLEVSRGEVFALLGPNGAGKTTLVEILEGHRSRSSGEVKVLGQDPGLRGRGFRERIGIVLQETGVEPFLTVAEAIELYRGYYAHPRPLEEIIGLVGLEENRDQRVNRLSGGQRRRLDVAIGLAGDPELVFLDEPTTGFDPTARRNAWELVQDLAALGKTIFLTTHYMEEAQALAGRVAIIVGGKIVAEGAPGSLIQTDASLTRISFVLGGEAPDLPEEIRALASQRQRGFEIETANPLAVLHALTGWALERQIDLSELRVSRPSLEDVYLSLTEAAGAGEEAAAGPGPARAKRRRGGRPGPGGRR